MIEQLSGLTGVSDGVLKSVSEKRYVAGPTGAGAAANPNEASFTDTLANVSLEAVDKLKQGEAAAIAGVDGQASVQQVVEAVMAAEASLQTAIAIRDKVVSAYQEISRMTI
ncbi:flagellar hook-basal body complex protein FliE [Roseibium sp.]|uniref:flagellar hook-basal body complex protein FliE n=1 Tax=Roseibium sp. TaxID=1936156 RepID=UPI003A96A397